MRTLTKQLLYTLSTWLLLTASLQVAWAAPPVLNWTRQGSGGGEAFLDCNRSGSTNSNCGSHTSGFGGVDEDVAPFLQETALFDGITYFHVIVGTRGEPTVGNGNSFAQEVYIQVQSGTDCDGSNGSAPCSQSGGRRGSAANCFFSCDYVATSGLGWDPLRADSTFTGNGSANPNAVIMKQVINDPANGLTQVFLKDSLSLKPKITQTVSDSGMTSQFVLDMSNSNYSTSATAGLMTNTVTLVGANAGIQGNFDAASTGTTFTTANAQTVNVTGGRYTYAAGTGWSGSGSTATYAAGSYTYVDSGSVNLTTLDWNSFRDPADNLMNFSSGGLGSRKRGGNVCKNGTATTPTAAGIAAGC